MSGERPKRPLSAYMLWLNENRESIKKENPGSKVTDIAKRGGELWRGLKDKTVSDHKTLQNYAFKPNSLYILLLPGMGTESHQNEGGIQQGGQGVRGKWRHRLWCAQEAKEGCRQARQEGQEERVIRGGRG